MQLCDRHRKDLIGRLSQRQLYTSSALEEAEKHTAYIACRANHYIRPDMSGCPVCLLMGQLLDSAVELTQQHQQKH